MEFPSRRELLIAGLAAAATYVLTKVGQEQGRTHAGGQDVFRPQPDLEIRESDIPLAIEKVKQSVFKIRGPGGHGTGFLIAPGLILTNYHVTRNNAFAVETKPIPTPFPLPVPLLPISKIHDANYEVGLFTDDDRKPGKTFRAQPAHLPDGSRAFFRDMALLQLPLNCPLCRQAQPIAFGKPEIGRRAIVLGNPSDLTGHVTMGRVSKEVVLSDENPELWSGVPFFTTDAAVNGGNSGGPVVGIEKVLVNGKPELRTPLIGMATWTYSGNQGMGGAIRADYLAYIVQTKWGVPLMNPQQLEEFKQRFPEVETG
jgi:S1-C subfamily serine protease